MSRVVTEEVVVAVLGAAAPAVRAHQGNPNFRSKVRSVAPAVDGGVGASGETLPPSGSDSPQAPAPQETDGGDSALAVVLAVLALLVAAFALLRTVRFSRARGRSV